MTYISGIGDEVILGFCGLLSVIYFLYQCVPPLFSQPEEAIDEDLNASGQVRNSSDDCSICLSETSYAIQTNCGHIYCAQCIISYYENVTSSSVTTALSKFFIEYLEKKIQNSNFRPFRNTHLSLLSTKNDNAATLLFTQ